VDILERIVEHLSSDEVRRFKILSNRFKADEEKKMLVLFDEIRNGSFKEREEKVITTLYGKVDSRAKNSYYRLRNKLLSSLEKSLLFYHFSPKNTIGAYSYLQLALLMRERSLHREALHHLKKAEKAAHAHEQFNVLEIIYDHMIQLAPYTEVDIASIIDQRKANRGRLEVIRANSEVLGMLNTELSRRNYARSKKSSSVIQSLEKVRKHLEEHAEVFHSLSGRTMVAKTVISILLQKSAYSELADYAKETFEHFEENGWFNRDNHALKLSLRVYRINSLQKLLQLGDADEEIAALGKELKAFSKQNYVEYAFHYYATQAFNYKYRGKTSAAEKVLKTALKDEEVLFEPPLAVYLWINLADLYFLREEYGKSLKAIEQMQLHPQFVGLATDMKLYVEVFRAVVLFELGKAEILVAHNRETRKTYRSLLRDPFYGQVKRFLDVLMRMQEAETEQKGLHLKATHKSFVKEYGQSEIGGNQILLYELYLQARAEGIPYSQLVQQQVG